MWLSGMLGGDVSRSVDVLNEKPCWRAAGRDAAEGGGTLQESIVMEGRGGEGRGDWKLRKTWRKGQVVAGCSEMAVRGAVPLVITGRSGTGRSNRAALEGVVQLDFPALLGGSGAIPPVSFETKLGRRSQDGSSSAPSLKRLRFSYFVLRNSGSPLFLFSPRVLHPSTAGLATEPERAAAATARRSQDGGRGMAVRWRAGAGACLPQGSGGNRLPPRSAAALCPLRRRRQPGRHAAAGDSPLDLTYSLRIFIRERKTYFYGVN